MSQATNVNGIPGAIWTNYVYLSSSGYTEPWNFCAANKVSPQRSAESMIHNSLEDSNTYANTIIGDKSQIEESGFENEVAGNQTSVDRSHPSAQQSKPGLLWQRRLRTKNKYPEREVDSTSERVWSYQASRNDRDIAVPALSSMVPQVNHERHLIQISSEAFVTRSSIEHQDESTDHHGTLSNSTEYVSLSSIENRGIQSAEVQSFLVSRSLEARSAQVNDQMALIDDTEMREVLRNARVIAASQHHGAVSYKKDFVNLSQIQATVRTNSANHHAEKGVIDEVLVSPAAGVVSDVADLRTSKVGRLRHICPHAGCRKDFSTSGHARRHSRVHECSKRFQCSFKGCEASFSRRDNCNQHHKNIHHSSLTSPFRAWITPGTAETDRPIQE